MININKNDLETINNMIKNISTESGEVLYTLKKLTDEIDNDFELKLYHESVMLGEDLDVMIGALKRITETLEYLEYSSRHLLTETEGSTS